MTMPMPGVVRNPRNHADDVAALFGDGGTVKLLYETADANANALIFVAPEGGGTDVPVFIFGDASIENADLAWFNGITEPTLVAVNDAKDAYASLDAGDDAVAASKGLYFKAAADEDIELINLSVTGTPRIFWDESEDQFSSTKGWVFGSDIDLGANKITTTNLSILELNDNLMQIKDAAGSNLKGLYVDAVLATGSLGLNASGAFINAIDSDSGTLILRAKDNGVAGLTEIARFVGAADPYFQIGRDDTGVALNAVTDMLVLQAGGGTGNEAANFGFGLPIKLGNAASEVEERASWDTVLVTATNGSEDARFDWNLMAGGAMNLAMQLTGVGVLSVDLGGTGSAAQVDLFDQYDDALVLRQGIQQHNRELMADMGILTRKDNGSGYMMNLQPMVRLLAGGIYQSRAMIDSLAERLENTERKLLEVR